MLELTSLEAERVSEEPEATRDAAGGRVTVGGVVVERNRSEVGGWQT